MFDRLLDLALSRDRAGADGDPGRRASQVVLSLPSTFRDAVGARVPGYLGTADVFRRLLEGAQRGVKVFSPYVDPTFTAFAQSARAPIQVITTLREPRMRVCGVLERLAATGAVAVRYLHERHARAQMFQLHAKMILADSALAYVGSANFTDTSLHYNLELGVLTEESSLIERLHGLFDWLWDFAARPLRP